jgi:hypothetical protein
MSIQAALPAEPATISAVKYCHVQSADKVRTSVGLAYCASSGEHGRPMLARFSLAAAFAQPV